METLKSGDVPALVTNAEVMQLLAARTEARAKHDAEVAAAADAVADSRTTNGRPGAKRKRRVDDTKRHRHRDWIESKLLDYLQSGPSATISGSGADSPDLAELVKTLRAPPLRNGKSNDGQKDGKRKSKNGGKNEAGSADNGYGLTDGEMLQILNHMPTELVELHLIIDDLPSRMSDERQEELLQLIATYAGRDGEQVEQKR